MADDMPPLSDEQKAELLAMRPRPRRYAINLDTPVLYLVDDRPLMVTGTPRSGGIELTAEEYEDYRAAMAHFDRWQDRLRDADV